MITTPKNNSKIIITSLKIKTMEYSIQAHKNSTERNLKELEEQKSLKLNSKEEAKKMFAMRERIAKKYPN